MSRTHKAPIAALMVSLATVCGTATAQVESHRLAGNLIDIQSVDEVLVGEHVRLENFDTPLGKLDLELDRVEVLTGDARLELGTAEGVVDLPAPEVVVLRGIVAGDVDSIAYIALSPYGTNGFVRKDGELVSISTGPYAQGKDLDRALRTAKMAQLIDPEGGPPSACGYTDGDERLAPMGLPQVKPVDPDDAGARGGAGSTCRIATVAIETDWEYTNRLFGGDGNAAAAYTISLMGALSEIYERDFNVRLAIPFLRVWESNDDPYSTDGDPLDQVRAHWNGNMSDVDRTVTHFLTGRQDTPYGGVAYVGVLCFNEFGYGVSAYLDGFFPYPLIDYSHSNWDVVVSAHEIGHNFGTGHTHSYEPTIDDCGNGDCSDPFGGTIMSYCHTCPGGLSNIQLAFHPRVKDFVSGYLNDVNCDLISVGVTAADDMATTLEETAVDLDLMGNDAAQSCDPFAFNAVDSVSANGGTVERFPGAGPVGRDLFRYTPPTGFQGMDTFQYSILGDQGVQSATVSVDVRALRPADDRLNPVPGLRVSYYELFSPSQLPDFSTLEPLSDEVSDSIAYPSTLGEFMNSGLNDNVGAVFEGYVFAHMDGVYTFWTESDDGSRLYIGDELVVENDGLHGMVERSGNIPLRAGWHQTRIEFFEAGGGAGLFARMAGPEMTRQDLSGLLITHEASSPCALADLNADQVIDFFDVSLFLTAFGQGDLSMDLNEDGALNFFDVAVFLNSFNAGCP